MVDNDQVNPLQALYYRSGKWKGRWDGHGIGQQMVVREESGSNSIPANMRTAQPESDDHTGKSGTQDPRTFRMWVDPEKV